MICVILYEKEFMMSNILYLLIFCSFLYSGEGKVSIYSSSLDASVYVDGKKVGKISKEPLMLSLLEGQHELMVANILDEDWQEVQRKKIVLKKDDVLNLRFSLDLEKNI